MSLDIISTSTQVALIVVAAVAAGWARARPNHPAAAWAGLFAGFLVSVVILDLFVGWVVGRAAPASSAFNEHRWVLLAPWGRISMAAGVLVAVMSIVLSYRSNRRVNSAWRRVALVGLRSVAVLAALTVFLEPAIELRQVAREPNRIAILVDESSSMDLREERNGPRRIDRARALLDNSAGVFEGWRKRHHIDFYSFSDGLYPAAEKTVARKNPEGQSTLLWSALEHARARYDGRDLAGIIVLSDGIATGGFAENRGQRGATSAAQKALLAALDTRVHTVWLGKDGLRDVAISRVLADEFAFVRTVVKVEAIIQSTGYRKRRIPVTLSSDGVDLRKKWVDIDPAAGDQHRVVFEFSPPRVGKFVYEVSTPVAKDEAVASNNRRSFILRVIRDKIRVLHVAGQPSWDVRSLRVLLKQNPNVDLISFFILRTPEDINMVPNQEMSLIPFPTRELFQEELPSFDLIVLQNFEYQPYAIGMYLENIRSYVENGGGLVMLGGPLSFASGRYTGTPVAKALPIEMPKSGSSTKSLLDTELFAPKLTRQGKAHPITTLRYERRDNANAWKELPLLEGTNIVGDPKRGSTVLAVHPVLRTATGKPMPVIACGEYGSGRSLSITTDSLWRWGFVAAARPNDQGKHYAKFWENTIRWLIQDPELRHLRVDSDAIEYSANDPIRLDIRVLDRDYTPLANAKVRITISRGTSPKRAKQVERKTIRVGDSGEGVYETTGLGAGVYRVRARSKIRGRTEEATDIFTIREGSIETDTPAAYPHVLRNLASGTGGQYLGHATELPANLPFDEPRIVRVDRRADVELWSRPSLLVLALMALGLEWLLRQRSGCL